MSVTIIPGDSYNCSNPAIAVPFADGVSDVELQAAYDAGAAIAELRVDLFANTAPEHVTHKIRQARSIFSTVLVTVRAQSEGGHWNGTDQDRLALYCAAIAEGAWVDVELSSRAVRDRVLEAAANRVPVILSFHDFSSTPDSALLSQKIAEAEQMGASIAKVAATPSSPRDLQTLAALLMKTRSIPLIVIGMGPLGAITRILFPVLGSFITFAHAGTSTAPGQLSIQETVDLLKRFYPEFKLRK